MNIGIYLAAAEHTRARRIASLLPSETFLLLGRFQRGTLDLDRFVGLELAVARVAVLLGRDPLALVEAGIAIASGVELVVVGAPPLRIEGVVVVEDDEALVTFLRGLADTRPEEAGGAARPS